MNRPYHHGNLHDSLVEVALAAVDRDGQVPSLRAVAALAGVSHNAPYRHFDNQADLLGYVAARCFAGLGAAVSAAVSEAETTEHRARAGLAAYLHYGLKHPTRYQLMFGSNSPLAAHTAAQQAGSEAFEMLVNTAREFDAVDPYTTAFQTFVTLHGAVDLLRQGFFPHGVATDHEFLFEQIVNSAFDILSAAK